MAISTGGRGGARAPQSALPVEGEQTLLKKHARLALQALKYDTRAKARWDI